MAARAISHVFFHLFPQVEQKSASPSYPDKNSAVWIGLYGLLDDCCSHESLYHQKKIIYPMLINASACIKHKIHDKGDKGTIILTIFHPIWPSHLEQWISAKSVWVIRPSSLTWMDVTLAGAWLIAFLPSNFTFKPLPCILCTQLAMCQLDASIEFYASLISNHNTYRNSAINKKQRCNITKNLTRFHQRVANDFRYCDVKQVPTRVI